MEKIAFLICCAYIAFLLMGCLSAPGDVSRDQVTYIDNFVKKCSREPKSC